MKQILIRADDLGYCEGVNFGIAKTVKDGFVRTVGLMPNMPTAAHGLKLLEGADICLGQHTNICLGKPCADPAKIPSLLDEHGNLKSSKVYRAAYAAGTEITSLDEMVLEVDAQYHRFVELTGREPQYFEGHAVMNNNFFKALEIVANRYHLKYNDMIPTEKIGHFNGKAIASCLPRSKEGQSLYQVFKDCVQSARKDIPTVFVFHPGYVDAYLLKNSSLNIRRTEDVELLSDPEIRRWLKEQSVELITYNDL